MDAQSTLLDLPRSRTWLIVVGVLLTLGGIFAILLPLVSTIAVALILGWVFLLVGLLLVVHAFRTQAEGRFGERLLQGLLPLIAGILMIASPVGAALTLTLLLGTYLVVEGTSRAVFAWRRRPARGWGWALFSAIVTLLLGVVILLELPGSALWILGLFAGLHLLFAGISHLSLAMALPRT